MTRVLLVDDEERIRASFTRALQSMDYVVETSPDGESAISLLASETFDVLITDLVMTGIDGLTVLRKAKELRPAMPVIILTGHGTVESAVDAMKQGAFDYISKPYNIDELELSLQRAVEHTRILTENLDLHKQVERRPGFADIIGESDSMQKIYRIIERVRNTKSTALIMGESGTGKELVARAIHFTGELASRPFITVNCGAIMDTLLESELFGHVKGSFTGAHRDKEGYFDVADGGTIFLDEVGEFSPTLQTRLLRVLQEGTYTRVGDVRERHSDVRIVAATNRDLRLEVSKGAFREDLYYRLNVITLNVPPLRNRVDDIAPLAMHFLNKFNQKLKKNILRIDDDTTALFMAHSWPGNVRELENTMERIVTFCDGDTITPECLPDNLVEMARLGIESAAKVRELLDQPYKDAKSHVVNEFNRNYFESILDACEGNIAAAARRAGMDRGCFYRFLKKYGLKTDSQ